MSCLKLPLITVPPNGGDVDGAGGFVFDLHPQTADVHVHDLQFAQVVFPPDALEDLLTGEGLAGVLHEHLHDGVLHLSQFDPLAVLLQRAVAGVEQEGLLQDLTRAGYEIIEAESGEEALEKLKDNPDVKVALLDVMLPGIDGFEVCRRIRATNTRIGIIMLTALSQEMDKVTGLMTGADDYVTKPFSPAELTARVDALMRRSGGSVAEEPVIQIQSDPFVLNTRNRTLEKNGERIKLTQVEYTIMQMFMENPGKALSREEILDRVWGRDYFGELKIVDVNIRRLRLKIEDDPTNPTYINTVWGYGYKWGN